MRVMRLWIPSGDAGTLATLSAMRQLARGAITDPLVRGTAVNIVRGLSGRDGYAQAHAIRNWLERSTAFQRDPAGVELLHGPRYLLSVLRQTGQPLRIDCDDVAVLAAALGGAVGLRARYVVVGFFSPNAPFRHVWTELSPPGDIIGARWVEMDVTRTAQNLPGFNAITRTKIVGAF